MAVTDEMRSMLAAKFEVIVPHLNQRQRRLLLAAETRALGHGGIRVVARAAGVREATVSAGVDELGCRRALGPGATCWWRPETGRRSGSGASTGAAGAGRTGGMWRSDVAVTVDHEIDPQAGQRVDPARPPSRPAFSRVWQRSRS